MPVKMKMRENGTEKGFNYIVRQWASPGTEREKKRGQSNERKVEVTRKYEFESGEK